MTAAEGRKDLKYDNNDSAVGLTERVNAHNQLINKKLGETEL